MSGKVHSVIGISTTIALLLVFIFIFKSDFSPINSLLMILGSFIGSLIVDIDSSKSKSSQMFNKILHHTIWVLIILTVIEKFFGYNIKFNIEFNSWYLVTFGILTTLGKLSPHRQFTHKIFGTACFIFCAYKAFPISFFSGFTIGYALHIFADKFTKARLKFLEFRLPCQNSRGKFDYHF